MKPRGNSSSSYAISLALHLLILLLLAFWYFFPQSTPRWHEFEFIRELAESVPEVPAAEAPAIPGTEAPTQNAEAVSLPVNPAVKPIASPVIESPVLGNEDASAKLPVPVDISNANKHLKDIANTGSADSDAYAYNASLVLGSSEAYIIRQSPPRINPIMDDEVLIEFRLSESGKVIMSSVSVLAYKQSAHWEAIRAEMPSWRFGFKGKYNAEKTYRIRVMFKVR